MLLENTRRVVVKLGSSLITNSEQTGLNEEWLKSLVEDIAQLQKSGYEVVIVSSGSVALGWRFLVPNGLHGDVEPRIEDKQAAAACGQTEAIRYYQQYFEPFGIHAALVLMTYNDTEVRRNYLNVKNTVETLLSYKVVPVINENDTVATQELRFGDNDRLSARIAEMVGADVLFLLSDVDGLFTANPHLDKDAQHIPEVFDITHEIERMAGKPLSGGVGSGGMVTKIEAAKIATSAGCHVVLTNGAHMHPLEYYKNGGLATNFISSDNPVNARKRWIAGSLHTTGDIYIDDGALKALHDGNSLLPAGVVDTKGDFERGDTVIIRDCRNNEIGRGLIAYDSDDARLIMGHQTKDISLIIGFAGRSALIHRDDLVVHPLNKETDYNNSQNEETK